jgi:hypothetical protein
MPEETEELQIPVATKQEEKSPLAETTPGVGSSSASSPQAPTPSSSPAEEETLKKSLIDLSDKDSLGIISTISDQIKDK